MQTYQEALPTNPAYANRIEWASCFLDLKMAVSLHEDKDQMWLTQDFGQYVEPPNVLLYKEDLLKMIGWLKSQGALTKEELLNA